MKILVLVLSVIFLPVPTATVAQEDTTASTNKAETEKLKDADQKTANNNKEDNARPSSKQAPEADRLKKRDLGDAFRRFVPSEAISADNAVPFPVDI